MTSRIRCQDNATDGNAAREPVLLAQVGTSQPSWPARYYILVLTTRFPGCSHIHYCSETCRVADMTDPKVQHHLACIRAEPISSSLALQFIAESPVHSEIRSFAQQIWNRIRAQSPRAPEILPPLKKFFVIALSDEEQLTAPVHAPIEQNLLLYWRESAHEIRYSMHVNSPWIPCTEGRMFSSYAAGSLCIRPVGGKTACSSGKIEDLTLGWGFVLDYNLREADPSYSVEYQETNRT